MVVQKDLALEMARIRLIATTTWCKGVGGSGTVGVGRGQGTGTRFYRHNFIRAMFRALPGAPPCGDGPQGGQEQVGGPPEPLLGYGN